MFAVISFAADDTLWENEIFYSQAKEWLGNLLAQYLEPSRVGEALEETEKRKVRTMATPYWALITEASRQRACSDSTQVNASSREDFPAPFNPAMQARLKER